MSTGEKSSQNPTEAAKEHDKPLGGAPPMPGPGQQPAQPQQGHPIPPGMQQGGMVYDPTKQPQQPGYGPPIYPQQPPGYGPPIYPQQPPGYPQQVPMQPQGYQQAGPQGVPAHQLAQPGQPPKPRPVEAIKSDMQVLSDAMRREQESQAAESPPSSGDETDTPENPEDLPMEDENLWLGSMDQEMDSAIDKFNNPRRRKRIEKSLEKMNVEELAMHGELRQKVRISAGFTVEYRTTSGAENQGILQELGKLDGSELYLRERLALMNLAAGLHSVGTETMPGHLVDDDFNVEAFQAKLKRVLRYPVQVLADMRVNYYWFDDRVRNIMIAEELGNG